MKKDLMLLMLYLMIFANTLEASPAKSNKEKSCANLDQPSRQFLEDLCKINNSVSVENQNFYEIVCVADVSKIDDKTLTSFHIGTICISEVRSIYTLNFIGSRLRQIPESVGNLPELTSLSTFGSLVQVVPVSVVKPKKLQYLHLDNSALGEIGSEIGELTELRQLSLTGNPKLIDLPDSLLNLKKHLHTICLDDSQVERMNTHAKNILKSFHVEDCVDSD